LANKVFQSSNALLLQFVQFAVFAVLQEIGSESAKVQIMQGATGVIILHFLMSRKLFLMIFK